MYTSAAAVKSYGREMGSVVVLVSVSVPLESPLEFVALESLLVFVPLVSPLVLVVLVVSSRY